MRKYYLDNIRWATVLVVVFYHVLFMYNHTLTSGVAGAVTDFAGQDALQYLLYPWFMVVLFLVSGACTRYALDKRSAKSFLAERTRKLLVPSTLGLLALAGRRGISTWRSAARSRISQPECPHRCSISSWSCRARVCCGHAMCCGSAPRPAGRAPHRGRAAACIAEREAVVFHGRKISRTRQPDAA